MKFNMESAKCSPNLHIHFKDTTISELDSKIIISVLQDCITQLSILGNTLPTPIEQCNVKYESPNKRYGSPEKKERLETRRIKLSLNDQILKKLQSERTFLEGVINNTIQDLKHNRKFNFLLRAVNYMEKIRSDDENLIEMEAFNQKMVQKLQTDVSEIKKNADIELVKKLETIAQLQDRLTDEINTRKITKSFVEKWEKNRYDQLTCKNTYEFNSKNEMLMKTSKNVENELKINENVTDHLTEACRKLNESILYWKEKYDSDIGNLEDRILSLKHFKEQQLSKFQQLEEVYNTRQKEMDEFSAIKEERRIRETKERLEHESAVCVQAWWRGLMVRRCLGQFRRRKKATKDPKAKKRKGGKSSKGKGKK